MPDPSNWTARLAGTVGPHARADALRTLDGAARRLAAVEVHGAAIWPTAGPDVDPIHYRANQGTALFDG